MGTIETSIPANQATKPHSSIMLEIPGLKISLSGIPALTVFLIIILLISSITVYLLTSKTESISSIIHSLNPKSEKKTAQNKSELLQFFLPDNLEYKKNHADFELWLDNNTGWWAKTPMTNSRIIDGKKVVLEGYWYQAQDPVADGELEDDQYASAIQNRAIKTLGVTDLGMLWIELQKLDIEK